MLVSYAGCGCAFPASNSCAPCASAAAHLQHTQQTACRPFRVRASLACPALSELLKEDTEVNEMRRAAGSGDAAEPVVSMAKGYMLTPLLSFHCFALSLPELSALLEEDEEGDETRGTTGSGDEAESEGVAMELTGNTMHTPAGPAAVVAASQDATPDFASECALGPGLCAGGGGGCQTCRGQRGTLVDRGLAAQQHAYMIWHGPSCTVCISRRP